MPVLVGLLLLVACGKDKPLQPEQRKEPTQVAEKADPSVPKESPPPVNNTKTIQGLRFFEAVRGDALPEETLPLVVSLHGQGDKPDTSQLSDFGFPVRVVWPQAPTLHEGGYQWFPFLAMDQPTPNLPEDIDAATARMAAFIKEYMTTRPTKGLPVVVGFSQGGMIALDLAIKHKDLIASVHPISAGLPKSLWPEKKPASHPEKQNSPLPTVRALHGTKDIIVPIDPTRELMRRMRQACYDVTFEEFEGAGHELTNPMGERMAIQLVDAVR